MRVYWWLLAAVYACMCASVCGSVCMLFAFAFTFVYDYILFHFHFISSASFCFFLLRTHCAHIQTNLVWRVLSFGTNFFLAFEWWQHCTIGICMYVEYMRPILTTVQKDEYRFERYYCTNTYREIVQRHGISTHKTLNVRQRETLFILVYSFTHVQRAVDASHTHKLYQIHWTIVGCMNVAHTEQWACIGLKYYQTQLQLTERKTWKKKKNEMSCYSERSEQARKRTATAAIEFRTQCIGVNETTCKHTRATHQSNVSTFIANS